MFDTFIKKIYSDKNFYMLKKSIIRQLDYLKSKSVSNSINKPLFIYEADESNSDYSTIKLYCLYDQKLLSNPDIYTNFFNNSISENQQPVNQDLSDVKQYRLFAEIIIQDKERFKGYYVDMKPVNTFYDRGYTINIFERLYEKIDKAIRPIVDRFNNKVPKSYIPNNKTFLNTNPFTNPLNNDFFDSEFVNNFLLTAIRDLQGLMIYTIRDTFGPSMGNDVYIKPGTEKDLKNLIHQFTYESLYKNPDLREFLLNTSYQIYSIFVTNPTKIVKDDEGNDITQSIDVKNSKDIFNTALKKVLNDFNSSDFSDLNNEITTYLKTKSNSVSIDNTLEIRNAVIEFIKSFKTKLIDEITSKVSTIVGDSKKSIQYNDLLKEGSYFNTFKKLVALHFNEDDASKLEPSVLHNRLFKDQTNTEGDLVEKKPEVEQPKQYITKQKVDNEQSQYFNDSSKLSKEDLQSNTVLQYNNLDSAPEYLSKEFFKQNPGYSYDDENDVFVYKNKVVTNDSINTKYQNWLNTNADDLNKTFEQELESDSSKSTDNKEEETNNETEDKSAPEYLNSSNIGTLSEQQIRTYFSSNKDKIRDSIRILSELYKSIDKMYGNYKNILSTYNVSEEQLKELKQGFIKSVYVKCKNALGLIELDIVREYLESILSYKENLNLGTLLKVMSWLLTTLTSIEKEILDPKDSTSGVYQRTKGAIRHFKNILTKAFTDLYSLDTSSLMKDTSFEFSQNLLHLSKTVGEDEVVRLFETNFRPIMKFKYNSQLDTLSDLDSNIYQLKNMHDIFEIFDIDISGVIYSYDKSQNDFINKDTKTSIHSKFEELGNQVMKSDELNKVLDNEDDYQKLLQLLIFSVYKNSFGEFLTSGIENFGSGIKGSKPRTFSALEEFLKSLQQNSGVTYYIAKGVDNSTLIKDSLQNILNTTDNDSISNLAKYIEQLEQKFNELIK